MWKEGMWRLHGDHEWGDHPFLIGIGHSVWFLYTRNDDGIAGPSE
jgi:hypothetical protein